MIIYYLRLRSRSWKSEKGKESAKEGGEGREEGRTERGKGKGRQLSGSYFRV